MKRIFIFGLMALFIVALGVIAFPAPPINSGFQLTMPPLPQANGQFIGPCLYTGELSAQKIRVWNNYIDSTGQNRLEWTWLVRSVNTSQSNILGCSTGFKGNITYTLDAVQAMQQDFNVQILNAIHPAPHPPLPIATGNDILAPGGITPPPPPINNTNSSGGGLPGP